MRDIQRQVFVYTLLAFRDDVERAQGPEHFFERVHDNLPEVIIVEHDRAVSIVVVLYK